MRGESFSRPKGVISGLKRKRKGKITEKTRKGEGKAVHVE